ncbi:hypothetical protein [Persephonella sp.]
METLEIKLKGVAVDVFSHEWIDEDVLNRSPVVLEKIGKRKGGFTLFMRSVSGAVEWYFSKGLTVIEVRENKGSKYLHIEHEDGQYWVDLPADNRVINFLKEFMEDQG